MSWIDDNGIDFYENNSNSKSLEKYWENGIHIDKNGKEYKLSEMKNEHLLNTIKFFDGADTSFLEEEFKSRL